MKALLDADIYAYRAAASSENEDIWIATSRLDNMINQTLDELKAEDYHLFLTGKGNFRYNINKDYKGNRVGKPRPKWEVAVKTYLKDQWEAETVEGIEADDALGIAQCAAKKDSTIICSIDKDLNQIPGWHYNFVKKEKYYVTPEEGLRYFYYQLLVGDVADNLKGVVGIGPKKAEGILHGVPLNELPDVVRSHYETEEDFEMQAACFWMQRKPNDNWKDYIDASSG